MSPRFTGSSTSNKNKYSRGHLAHRFLSRNSKTQRMQLRGQLLAYRNVGRPVRRCDKGARGVRCSTASAQVDAAVPEQLAQVTLKDQTQATGGTGVRE